jgi:hypothetical protein
LCVWLVYGARWGAPVRPRPGLLALRFAIHVSGQRAAEATLWVHAETGWPVQREQTVAFPTGRMVVTERYDVSAETRGGRP